MFGPVFKTSRWEVVGLTHYPMGNERVAPRHPDELRKAPNRELALMPPNLLLAGRAISSTLTNSGSYSSLTRFLWLNPDVH
jgi:hypothetical protein